MRIFRALRGDCFTALAALAQPVSLSPNVFLCQCIMFTTAGPCCTNPVQPILKQLPV